MLCDVEDIGSTPLVLGSTVRQTNACDVET